MTKSFPPTCGGYRPGHPWYYILGGVILRPKQILTCAQASDYQGYMTDDIQAMDRKAEPQRSEALRKTRLIILASLKSDLARYRYFARGLRIVRQRNLAADTPQKCENIHTAINLKHNHLYNDFAILIYLDELLQRQPDLFDLA